MIIGTCGFCSTGSSAVSDYLKEFDDNQVIDCLEFTLTYLPDGLEDLEYHLTRNVNRDDNSCIAIPRFRRYMRLQEHQMVHFSSLSKREARAITDDFLDEIVQLKWISSRRSDSMLFPSWFYRKIGRGLVLHRIMPILMKAFNCSFPMWPNRLLEVSINPRNFEEKSRAFVKRILQVYGADFSKNIVLDQPFIGNDPAKSFKYFDNPIAIVVDRDPRDNYIFAREFLSKKGRYMPIDNVREFVDYYKLLRHNQPYQEPNDRILRLNFEEMVYDYDNATAKIRAFCQLPENPRPFTVFDPKLSVNNTQLILKYPKYKKDVEYIEQELPEYLFNFDRFPKPDHSGQMFMGKSPLNK